MATPGQPASGDLNTALQHAAFLCPRDPVEAEQQAIEILRAYPDCDPAKQILAAAHRLQGNPAKALSVLESISRCSQPSADLLHEKGLCLGALGRGEIAIAALRQAIKLDPRHVAAWRTLGDQLTVAGDEVSAADAYERHLALISRHPELLIAAKHVQQGRLAQAEPLVRDVLKKDPTDVAAIRLLAAIGVKVGQLVDATHLLQRCLELAPEFHLARHNYAVLLVRRHKLETALEQIKILLRAEPNNPNFLILQGTTLVKMGEHAAALEIYERILKDYPRQAGAHMNYGHTLKTVGRLDESIDAYRICIKLSPGTGEAYWSLANLKTFQFSDDDIQVMRAQIVESGGDPEDQAHLSFALGKALEDHKAFDESFQHYQRGNAIRGKHHRHSAKINVFNSARQIKTCDQSFFQERKGWGCTAADPIFIVGLPRAGSTLLEQILASHSAVEGTAELPDIIATSRRLGQGSRKNPASKYPEILTTLSLDDVLALGENYIESTRVQRHGLPFFIDKLPNNFQHIGLIHLILPNAKIIDARRHPMAGCYSCFKQLFARGQTFTYDLTDLGRYYRDYVRLMDHWDDVLPGRILRMQYEKVVNDTENQVRRMLDYCGLSFQEECLRFYETDRAIRTPSAEQVRQPVYTEGLEQWRNVEKHLGPLKAALGPLLDRYPIE